jgi:hypothetical protein
MSADTLQNTLLYNIKFSYQADLTLHININM